MTSVYNCCWKFLFTYSIHKFCSQLLMKNQKLQQIVTKSNNWILYAATASNIWCWALHSLAKTCFPPCVVDYILRCFSWKISVKSSLFNPLYCFSSQRSNLANIPRALWTIGLNNLFLDYFHFFIFIEMK